MALTGNYHVAGFGFDIPNAYVRVEGLALQRIKDGLRLIASVAVYASAQAAADGSMPVQTRTVDLNLLDPAVKNSLLTAAYNALKGVPDFANMADVP